MKRLLFTLLILASGTHALPKKSLAGLFASVGISGLAWQTYQLLNPSYSMKKEPMISAKINVPKKAQSVQLNGYHSAINANNDIYDYQLWSSEVHLWNAAHKIGHAYIICTRQAEQQPRECNLLKLRIKQPYRYQGLGSVLLQEAINDLKQRTVVDEFNLVARAKEGTSQERLENFYKKNGAQQKETRTHEKEFVFNLNKI